MTHGVHIVAALRSEAAPFISHFDLKRQPSSTRIPIYADGNIALVVSGMGKAAASNAVADLGRLYPDRASAWLNVGIAGHQFLKIGAGYLANCISDSATGQKWYPVFVFDHGCLTGAVTTVDEPETEYAEPTGYDMEASGFAAAALRLATVEMVHCYKIVSDNSQSTLSQLTRQRVAELAGFHVQAIERIINSLDGLAAEVATRNPSDLILQPFLEKWKFSVTQQHLLFKLLRKTNSLGMVIDVNASVVRDCRNASEAIEAISEKIHSYWWHQHTNV